MNSKFNAETKVWEGVKIPYPVPLDVHLSELVIRKLEETPTRVIQISYDDGSEMTGEELRLKIIRVAQHLTNLGIKDEDVVGVLCENSMDLMAFVNGIMQLGAIVNAMSVDHSQDDLLSMFRDTKPKLVLCDAKAYEKVKNVLSELHLAAPIFITHGEVDGALSADELFKATGEEEAYQVTKFNDPTNKILSILPSSGTTGTSKGVCMSQSFFLKFLSLASGDEVRSLSFSAIFWGSAFGSMLLCPISPEVRIVTRKSFTPELFIDMATKHKATHLLMNPPKLTLLLQSPLMKTFDVSNVKVVMSLGGIVSIEMRKMMKKAFPKAYFMIFYGLTEVSGALTFPGQPIDDLTVGFVAPNHLLKIVDDNGNALGVGETGEIVLKFSVNRFLVSRTAISITTASMTCLSCRVTTTNQKQPQNLWTLMILSKPVISDTSTSRVSSTLSTAKKISLSTVDTTLIPQKLKM
jgi:4-coumarate--CoA ligase